MTDWLFDTFLYTGLLIGVVLLLRRPAAAHFGPTFAYGLWALPLLRFLMPPIVLPSSMAPAPETAPGVATEPLLLIADQVPAEPVEAAAYTPLDAAAVAAAGPGFDWTELVLPLWLVGAALFLAWRTWSYFEMRKALLADARPVGEAGSVRLVETPAVSAPVAFGVRDKVVALPVLFMAHPDRDARDLAISHELAHHRGHDLLANIAAQPLLALHWFNPIAWLGWRAMRRDQEAACDARVMDGRNRDERAAYAHVIASFAQGERLALAAPMACPILGEKSIIHRLRSLSMSDIPSSRRWLGRGLMAAGAFALPLTASVSYAAAEDIDPIESVDVPASDYTSDSGEADGATTKRVIKVVRTGDGDGEEHEITWNSADDLDVDFHPEMSEEDIAEMRRDMAEAQREIRDAQREIEQARREMEREVRSSARETGMSQAEIRRIQSDALAQAEQALEMAQRQVADAGAQQRLIKVAMASAQANMPEIIEGCAGDSRQPVTTTVTAGGKTRIMICERGIKAQALSGVRSARAAIATDPGLDAEERAEALREMDEAIAELQNES